MFQENQADIADREQISKLGKAGRDKPKRPVKVTLPSPPHQLMRVHLYNDRITHVTIVNNFVCLYNDCITCVMFTCVIFDYCIVENL